MKVFSTLFFILSFLTISTVFAQLNQKPQPRDWPEKLWRETVSLADEGGGAITQ
jgi:hypothetical protein